MAGGHMKYRHLNRDSSHRQALLRNLVTSLITHETIQTTWHKAKEAQRLAEKLITLGKKNTNASRLRAEQILFSPLRHVNKLFGELRLRYANRPGGYTRVLHIEPINRHHDQAPSAILELVDGPKDMRFAMTAKSLVRERAAAAENEEKGIRDITAKNIRKVTRYRADGDTALLKEVERLEVDEGKKRESDAERRRKVEEMKGERMEKYEEAKESWDSRLPRERFGTEEPKEPEDDEWEEYDLETQPRNEGWEPYRYHQMQQRTRRREKDEQSKKEEKKKKKNEQDAGT